MTQEIKTPNHSDIESISHPMDRLLAIMALLRGPNGCPWDREQTMESLKSYLVEETYEVLDAIDRGEPEKHMEELGDLLLQVVFQAQVASDEGQFEFRDVADTISAKLVRRHAHIFGDEVANTATEVLKKWEKIKEQEKNGGNKGENGGMFDGVPAHLPALLKTNRICQKASRVGFDWPDLKGVLDKFQEEIEELGSAIDDREATRQELVHEIGDVLFAAANIARKLEIDPEDALQQANARFIRRFRHIEAALRERGITPSQSNLEEMDKLWNEAKKLESNDSNRK